MLSNIEKLMEQIYTLKNIKEKQSQNVTQIKAEIEQIDIEIEKLSQALLNEFKDNNINIYNYEAGNIVAEKFSRENVGYTNDNDIVNYLKTNYNGEYIKTKITESLDKNALKKAMKSDTKLLEALDAMTVKSITEYIVVTDSENHKKMLEHINGTNS